jgi:hypothetical protein
VRMVGSVRDEIRRSLPFGKPTREAASPRTSLLARHARREARGSGPAALRTSPAYSRRLVSGTRIAILVTSFRAPPCRAEGARADQVEDPPARRCSMRSSPLRREERLERASSLVDGDFDAPPRRVGADEDPRRGPGLHRLRAGGRNQPAHSPCSRRAQRRGGAEGHRGMHPSPRREGGAREEAKAARSRFAGGRWDAVSGRSKE